MIGALKATLILASFFGISEAITTQDITPQQWAALNTTVQGRLNTALPFAAPCFPVVNGEVSTVDNASCATIQENYLSPTFRSTLVGAYSWPEFETCMSTSEQCLLDASDPSNPAAWTEFNCTQGSVSAYYIEVEEASDVQAAFDFANSTGVPLTIKNTGHDSLGRSSMKGSLAVWTHKLDSLSYNETFVPEGGSQSYPAITIGAGVAWAQTYAFADANNVTAVGGYHETVGSSGGWLLGGGHGPLSPVYGLGVDRVLQFRVVTADGQYRVANSFINPDLFWALRGGGGSAFGVVIESTILVEPQLTLQVASLSLNLTEANSRDFYTVLVDGGLQWGQQGWGGNVLASNLTLINPLLNLEEAQASLKNLTDYVVSQNGTVVIEQLPSWYAVFTKYALSPNVVNVGVEVALGSRLLPISLFSDDTGKEQVIDLLTEVFQYGAASIILAPPVLYNYTEGTTSVTTAWRTALWHVIAQTLFEFDSTLDEKQAAFDLAHNLTERMKVVAPDSGAYFNEADTYESDFEESFWGSSNYARLLEVKQQYDPNGLLDCWRCVGWKGQSDTRYSCYLPGNGN